MIDATDFADVELTLIEALKAVFNDLYVSNRTPTPIPAGGAIVLGYAGSPSRAWGEASANVGFNVFGDDDEACRALMKALQRALAVHSSNTINGVSVPVGATSIPRQGPPFQRYFAATVWLSGQDVIEDLS